MMIEFVLSFAFLGDLTNYEIVAQLYISFDSTQKTKVILEG